MNCAAASALAMILVAASPALADEAPNAENNEIHADYTTYAVGLHVADVQAGFGLGTWSYQMQLVYRTTGLVGLFYHGHQINTVRGSWDAGQPEPQEFFGDGFWHGVHRITLIDYNQGQPVVRELQPPNEAERQPIPADLLAHTMDTLSALADLMRHVDGGEGCETTVHTYDGRRVTVVNAHTAGTEMLAPTPRSVFSGKALRCDFEGRMLAGFLLGDSNEAHRRPLHGTAWLAQAVPGEPPVPVRMVVETLWFGDVTMYLTSASVGQWSLSTKD